jgi:hypothetical protein
LSSCERGVSSMTSNCDPFQRFHRPDTLSLHTCTVAAACAPPDSRSPPCDSRFFTSPPLLRRASSRMHRSPRRSCGASTPSSFNPAKGFSRIGGKPNGPRLHQASIESSFMIVGRSALSTRADRLLGCFRSDTKRSPRRGDRSQDRGVSPSRGALRASV